MSSRLNKEREKILQPRRMGKAKYKIRDLGFTIIFSDETQLQFMYKGEKVNFFPYSGWHTGKSIIDGRGLYRLLNQLT